MVAIKDMEMPESCYECIVKNHCGVGIADGWRTDRRADDCPLAEIEERKVGKWLVKDNGNGGKYVECPFCGALAPLQNLLIGQFGSIQNSVTIAETN